MLLEKNVNFGQIENGTMKLKITELIFIFCVSTYMANAQKVSKLTITDNLSTAGRFTLGKAKPAAPRDTFYLRRRIVRLLFYDCIPAYRRTL